MDFLDSIDLISTESKSNRVRSWYLYEQFKSLERNQLDAAQKLKERSYQDRILRQELSERRARRKLYSQYGESHSESHIIKKSAREGNETSVSASTDDFFESFCELQEDERSSEGGERDTDTEDAYSQDDSQAGKRYLDEFKSLENIKDDQSFADSVDSVVRNCKLEDFAEDMGEEFNLVSNNIAEEIAQQFETVKENIQCLEKYSKLCDEDKISEAESSETVTESDLKKSLCHNRESDVNLYNMWSKLVSFAYQVTQMNHGNCYYDYSSQFLTAVLAFDVLRRGVNRMCHILQPYVSPIKFATDESDASTASNEKTKKKKTSSKKSRKPIVNQKNPRCECQKRCKTRSRYFSDDYWCNLSKHSFGHKKRVESRNSEPWRSLTKFSPRKDDLSEKSSHSFWPTFSTHKLSDECLCQAKVANPMLKIGQYIEKLINDIDECQHL